MPDHWPVHQLTSGAYALFGPLSQMVPSCHTLLPFSVMHTACRHTLDPLMQCWGHSEICFCLLTLLSPLRMATDLSLQSCPKTCWLFQVPA